MFRYHIKSDSNTPIYRQLVDQIHADIRSGVLQNGVQLPTVREMAQRMQLSCGTVKRVYDCLQEMGDIEMTRRRGTFVKYAHTERDSHKIQGMNAIDQMIRRLTELNFSPAEIQIFINLKMREWGMKWMGVCIAVAESCAECVCCVEEQLKQIGNVSVSVWPLRQIREYPYGVVEQNDVILTAPENYRMLQSLLPEEEKLLSVALEPEKGFWLEAARFEGKRVGVICEDEGFAETLKRQLPEKMGGRMCLCMAQDAAEVGTFLETLDCLIVAPDYQSRFDAPITEKIDAFPDVIPFRYLIDRGSMLYLQERIARIRDERQMRPVAFLF